MILDHHIQQTIKTEKLTQEQGAIYGHQFAKTVACYLRPTDKTIKVDVAEVKRELGKNKPTHKNIKSEITDSQKTIDKKVSELEKDIETHFKNQTVVTEAFARNARNKTPPTPIEQAIHLMDWAEGTHLVGLGLIIAGRLCHNAQLMKLGNAAVGLSSIMKGFIGFAANGFSFGSANVILGGINTVLGCFEKQDNHLAEALAAIMQQLQVISKQIYDMHQDMREQFSRVFRVLGNIHYDMLKHFMELHRETKNVHHKLVEIRECLFEIQGGISTLRRDRVQSDLRNQTLHYTHLDAEWVKAVNYCKNLLESGGADLKLLKEQKASLLAALNTTRDLKAQTHTLSDTDAMSKLLNQSITNAEENFALLHAYSLKGKKSQSIHEPHAWAATSAQLIALFHAFEQSKAYKGMPEPLFNDFQHVLTSGNAIVQFITDIRQPAFIKQLFSDYKNSLLDVLQIIQTIKVTKENALNENCINELNHQLEQQYNDFAQQAIDQITISIIGNWYTHGGFNLYGYGLRRPYIAFDTRNYAETQNNAVTRAKNAESTYIAQRKENILGQFARAKQFLATQLKLTKSDIDIRFDGKISIKSAQRLCLMIRPVSSQSFTIILPLKNSNLTVPQEYYEAYVLGLGQLSYFYEVNADQSILKISAFFKRNNENPFLVKTWDIQLANPHSKLNNPPVYNKHLNPNEALWNFWMGGYCAATDQSITYVTDARNDACSYYEYFCCQPVLAQHEGYQDCVSPDALTTQHDYNDECKAILKKEISQMNQKLNDYLFEQSNSTRPNSLLTALKKLDASAKLLYAYLALALNHTMQDDTFFHEMICLFNKDKMDDFLKSADHLDEQLKVNLEVLNQFEAHALDCLQNTGIEEEYSSLFAEMSNLQQLMAAHEDKTITWEEAENSAAFNADSYSKGLEFGKKLAISTIVLALNANQFTEAAAVLSQKMEVEVVGTDQEVNPALKQGFTQALSLEVHNASAILLESKQYEAASWLLKFAHQELWKLTNQQTSQLSLTTSTSTENETNNAAPTKKRKTSQTTYKPFFGSRENQADELKRKNKTIDLSESMIDDELQEDAMDDSEDSSAATTFDSSFSCQ